MTVARHLLMQGRRIGGGGAPPEEYTEEQTQENGNITMGLASTQRMGQRLTIPNRQVTKLGFWLHREGAISGDVWFRIRRVSNDSIILEKVAVDAGDIPIVKTYFEVEFATPAVIDEEVYILVEWAQGGFQKMIHFYRQLTDVKPDEFMVHYGNSAYTNHPTWDATYRYKYYEV